MKETLEQLKPRFEQALAAALGAEYGGVDPILVPASNPKFGDYQANVALPLAKQVGKPPRAIAEQIVSKLDVSDICETPTVAGPGFINLTLKPAYLEAQLQKINPDPRLGIAPVKHPKKVIVDYPSPNIAKEMHVGHLRPAVIGDCISRILEFIGHDVVRLSHVGDWGTPFGMLIAYLQIAYPEALMTPEALMIPENLDLGDLSSFYRQAKKLFDTDEEFKEAARQAVVQLQAGEEKTILAWKIVCQLSSKAYRVIYDLMGIAPFIERGESFYNALLAETIEDLEAKGLVEIDAGAKCVFLEGFTNKEGKPLPLIVQKSDGGYNYATTDLAAIRYRVNVDKAQRVIYPVGAEQTNHFAQIFQVGKRAGWITDEVEFYHAPFGLVLGEDGSKLKTRSGEAVRLKDLLDEAIAHARKDLESRLKEEGREETEEFINHVAQVIGISAVKYADLSQNRNSNYIFSYDKMLALQGNTAPYMLYAYARIQGISRKGGIDFEQLGDNVKVVLQHETELVLAKHLLQLDEVISTIEADLLPNRLCEYLFQLSQKFNQFYDRDRGVPVLNAEEPQRTSRLVLCNLTARTLKLGLSLLGIPVLERM
ncbi:MAG: Arginine--tRNA ligase [Chroococcidiopsis sp. SAG 2025]|uniref:arginine--tRNA ligase n=1 Tax=Chroococcidiopsis sp. SAG 2025 TaxID=171389 RepID=UPI002936D94E|nr:arginine--tRNA ligase [Chroococcidiopsis sp. SAG 2025]MDV2996721.1 Arginine--tRNA ligase [Chroococcidiopsis sp. SAG 2025]